MADALKMVGRKIKEIRKTRGYSQDQLGEKCGFHFSYIGGVERGERNLSLENLTKIAEALQVQLKELFHFDDSITDERERALDDVIAILNTLDIRKINMVKSILTEITSAYSDQ